MSIYLTEDNLELILKTVVPDLIFVRDKSVPSASNKRYRPDFRCETEKLIIEFDGDTHYRSSQRILVDFEKDEIYRTMGYRVIRIPYFIQMTEEVFFYIFNREIKFKQMYLNGFIDSTVILPADFCELGVRRFLKDLDIFHFHKIEILWSLKNKLNEKKNIELVLPPSISYLLQDLT